MSLPTVVLVGALVALSALAILFVFALARSAATADRRTELLLSELSGDPLRALGAAANVEIEARRLQQPSATAPIPASLSW